MTDAEPSPPSESEGETSSPEPVEPSGDDQQGANADSVSPVPNTEDAPLEGGTVRDVGEELPVFNRKRHEAITARTLSYLLVGVLGGYFVLHYLAILLALANGWDTGLLEEIFNAALPVLSGLAGSAATYFFTRREE